MEIRGVNITNANITAGGGGEDPTVWQSTHDTTGRTDDSKVVELNFGASTGDRTIDWGDGTVEVNNNALPSHEYAVDGEYVVRCYGGTTTRLGERDFSTNQGWTHTLKSVDRWGDLGFTSFELAFYDVQGNFGIPNNIPSSVTNMNQMFSGASAFNQDIGAWNTSSVDDMFSMFFGASAFNQDIGAWDISSVPDMGQMFYNASSFNGNISGWDTSNVTNMFAMFFGTAFNQDISGWNTSSVTNMEQMFANASSFNENIGGWNIGNVTNMSSMFFFADSMSCENYTDTLVGWANYVNDNNQPLNINLSNSTGQTFATSRSGGANFADAGAARNYLTTTAGWTISGDTVQSNC